MYGFPHVPGNLYVPEDFYGSANVPVYLPLGTCVPEQRNVSEDLMRMFLWVLMSLRTSMFLLMFLRMFLWTRMFLKNLRFLRTLIWSSGPLRSCLCSCVCSLWSCLCSLCSSWSLCPLRPLCSACSVGATNQTTVGLKATTPKLLKG